jgi:DNA-binding MarR family transcriptional regulator
VCYTCNPYGKLCAQDTQISFDHASYQEVNTMASTPKHSLEEAAALAMRALPAIPHADADAPGSHLPDGLVDSLDKTFRRLRKTMVRPPQGFVPVPALGRQLDVAKIFACDAVADLAATERTVTVKDVAGVLDLEHSTVSRLLGEMEDDGLVTRGSDAADRRRTTVTLTDLGRAVVADATTMTRFFMRLMLSDWPVQDVESLTRLLGRLADTVHGKLDQLPEQAIAEFCRVNPGAAPGATPATTEPSVP